MDHSTDILCERQGAAGLVTLNRPRALNALNLGMVEEMTRALEAWAKDPAVTRVVVLGAGEKAFCAGGDIRHLTELGREGRKAEALDFWREEYRLNALIKRYPKPYVSLIDGIVMGGGVGISLHGSHRVAGERYLFAMPEVGIGFFPDVGATYALPRLPGEMGMYIALTGERIRRADAVLLGLATHAVDSGRMGEVREALVAGMPVEEVLAGASVDPGPAPLAAHRELIDACFSAESVPAILRRLDKAAEKGSEHAGTLAATIRTKSPTSLSIAFEQVRRGRSLDFVEAMRTEFRIVSRIIDGHDFYEGVRATLVDKDGAPQWRPATLDALDPATVDGYFGGLGPDELEIA
ncbi:enoyl-CoA hydratase/isomerase family protein [Microvirga sp. 17 mud 1-3]|uniref:enoyl-CoA hydratase/isomerase family protein n=1 Tax=Microvirga sp. 17 mud 1-3 TaxID=2082949 RepID=UPI000D6B9C6D|nr:enoyl-CoA hydratase/isomerase family protein [Microvirga sp. 17 mud 1-3]AWM86961.1 3-hydroxyisobutyryl-CoA hydrolase [Microvirga sp. 17 mud 1-3]